MKRAWKKIAAIVAAACLALCGLILAACGDGDKQDDYSVTLAFQSGRVVPDAKVIFTPEAEGKETKTVEAVTDEEGKCTVRLYTDIDYSVAADNLPEDFILQTKKIHTTKGEEIQLKIVLPEEYSFAVTGPAGADLSNITVSYSATVDGERKPLGQTGEDGKLIARMEPVNGYAFITPPEGYVYNEFYGSNSNCPYKMSSVKPEKITFELISHEKLTLENAISSEEINAFQQATGNTVLENMMKSSIRKAYSFSKTSAEAHTVYSFEAKEAGDYWVFVNYKNKDDAEEGDANEVETDKVDFVFSVSNSLNLDPKSALNSISGSFSNFSVVCEEGATYYLNVNADTTEQELQFLIVSPEERNETLVTAEGDVTLSVLENIPAEIRFMPSVAGEYTFTTDSNVKIEVISNGYTGETSVDGTIKIEVTSGHLYYGDGTPSHITWYLRFTALGENPVYPLNVTVHVTRENIIEYTLQVRVVEVTETLTKYEDQTGTLTAIGVNNTTGQVVKGDDGYWHYGDKDGAVVVVQLKGNIPVFYPETKFEDVDKERDFFRFLVGTDEEKHVYLHDDYTQLFHTYTEYVNKDGMYRLTDELAALLKLVAKQNEPFFKTCVSNYTADSLWLFSAFYYAE